MAEDRDVLFLTEAMLETLDVSPADIVEAIEAAVAAQAGQQLWTAPKSAILPGDGRYVMTTLSVADAPPLTVIKTAMVAPGNPARGLNGIEAGIFVLDSETGLLRCVMGGNWATAVRTAGLSAVLARRLGDPASSVLACIGTGVQARSHMDAFAALFPLREVRMVGRGQANIDRLTAHAEGVGLTAAVSASPREAIEGADLIVSSITLDYDTEPFLDARWMKPGAFAAITDLGIPWRPEGMAALDAAYIDDCEQESVSARKLIDPGLVTGDLGEVVRGEAPAAFDPGRRTAFLFRGIALGDFAVAALVYRRAVAKGVGTVVPG